MGGDTGLVSTFRTSGSTRVTLPRVEDDFLEAVQQLTEGEFEILGQMGRGANLSIVYLARDLGDQSLVALRLEPGVGEEYLLEIVEQLDESLPVVESSCSRCGAEARSWGRYCHQCGLDLAGTTPPGATERASRGELLQEVREAARGRYEVLGEMRRSQGGGAVYFARELATGKLVTLRLTREQGNEYSVGLTGVLQPLAESLGTPVGTPVPPAEAPERPPPAQQAHPRPSVRAVAPHVPDRRETPWAPVIALLQQPIFVGGLMVIISLMLLIILALVI